MFQPERQSGMLEYLATHEFLSLQEAVRRYAASAATVRRDFADLERRNLARRAHGGLCPLRQEDAQPFVFRAARFAKEKAALARAAAALLADGDAVTVDGGSTTFHLASCLPEIHLKLITNSLRLAAALEPRTTGRPGLELYVTGGCLRPASGLLTGPGVLHSLAQYRTRWAFLSAGGVQEGGLFNTDEQVAEMERGMIAGAEKTVVLADGSKLGRSAMCHVAPLEKISILITNAGVPSDHPVLAACREKGVKIIFAE